MKLSKKTQYGLRAMVYLAIAFRDDKKRICSLKEISEKEKISFDYLEKIMTELEKNNLVKSKRGFKGGYFLKKDPKKIKVGEIINVLEGGIDIVECLAKKKRYKCPRRSVCKTVNVWQKIQEILTSALSSMTLADLIK